VTVDLSRPFVVAAQAAAPPPPGRRRDHLGLTGHRSTSAPAPARLLPICVAALDP
jgi:hypothetical protein